MYPNEIERFRVRANCLASPFFGNAGDIIKTDTTRNLQLAFCNSSTWVASGKQLPIEKASTGKPEIHYTRICSAFRRWQANGCIDAIFTGSVLTLKQTGHLDTSVIHGDGTTTVAKKGGDNIGLSDHKRVKGDKVVIFCDRNCNAIVPLVSAPGNRNELRAPHSGFDDLELMKIMSSKSTITR